MNHTPYDILRAIFGAEWVDNVHITHFHGNPKDGHWNGFRIKDRWPDPARMTLPADHSCYFSIGMQSRASTGRSIRNHIIDFLVVLDDVGQKVPLDQVDALRAFGLEPIMVVQTSPGNWQYFYRLDEPVFRTDFDRKQRVVQLDMVRDAIKHKGWGDSAVQEPVRYMRLPFGCNAKYEGSPAVELAEFNEQARVSLDDLCDVLVGGDWRAQLASGAVVRQLPASAGLGSDRHASIEDVYVQLAAEIGLAPYSVRPGVVGATCPNAAQHSSGDPSGFAFINPYRAYCQHDHCQGLSSADFMDMIEGEYESQVRARVAAGELVEADGVVRDKSGAVVPATGRSWMAAYEAKRHPIEQQELTRIQRVATEYELTRDKTPDWVREMNERFAIAPGIAGVIDFGQRADDSNLFDVITVGHFQTLTGNEKVHEPGRKGPPRGKGVVWLEHPDRREYDDIGMWLVGQEPPRMLNLWKGIRMPHVPLSTATSCDIILDYLFRGVCDSDAVKFEWVLNWMAWKVQNPLEKPGTNLALFGSQGTGKSTCGLLIMDIFGRQFSLHVLNDKHVLSNFNAHLEGKLIVLMDEAMFGKDPRVSGLYKALTTENTMMIERKGVNARPVPNRMALILASNSLASVPIEPGDRRTTVLRVSDTFRNNGAFFTSLWDQWRNGGREKFIELLLARDLRNYDPRVCLSTPEKAQMAATTGDVVTRWWLDRCNSGRAPGGGDWAAPVTLSYGELLADHQVWARDVNARAATRDEVLAGIQTLCPDARRVRPNAPAGAKRERGYQLPNAERCLELANVALGGLTPSVSAASSP